MKEDKISELVIYLLMIFPVVYTALLIAPYLKDGLFSLVMNFDQIISHPFSIVWCKDSSRCIAALMIGYFLCVLYFTNINKNYRKTGSYGSARWADNNMVNRKYADKDEFANKIFTQHVRMGLDGRKHRRNLNTLVIGGSGAGKTRFYAKINVMQCNTSFVVTDPKGELARDTGHLLEKKGYVVKVLDLIDMEKSHGYNPFRYIKDDKDILKLITNLIRNTTPKGSNSSDPFWEKSETALLEALCLYLFHEAPEEEQNFTMVMEMIAAAEVKEDDEDYQSPLDELFDRLEMREPGTLAYKQYRIYKQAAGKTAKSILISVGVRLAAFNFDNIASITSYDELELETIGERKTALFAIIPDNDSTFNFIVGMLYTQLFQTLYYNADKVHKGALPIPVHVLMDEFANVALPDEFDKVLSTMRSRNIFVSIIIQNLAQIKTLFKDSWESIVGNCDELYYLGGNEQSTHKFMSEYLGKETIDIDNQSVSKGKNGSSSVSHQQTGRELLTPEEVRLLDNNYGLLFIRGERAIFDHKYDILKHPNLSLTVDGGAPLYEHGNTKNVFIDDWLEIPVSDNEYELLFPEDMENYFKQKENKKNEK